MVTEWKRGTKVEDVQSPPYYAAVVVINSDGEVLLGKRKEDGIWTTPGGGAEPGEMNPPKTAARELFEEAGIPADVRFLQPLEQIATRNGKICHTFLYVVSNGQETTSKLDPDQEVGTWKWFKMSELPKSLIDDPRRHASVRAGFMKYFDVQKSLIDTLEKGGKPAAVGEIRNFGGKDFQKMGNGEWKQFVHPEEKQLEAEQKKNKVVSLTDKLKNTIAEKKEVSASEKHLHDLENQAVVEGQETRSGKPMFTKVEAALSHGYEAQDFREVGNFYYDRAQKMADNIAKLEATKQQVDPNFEKIKKVNLRMAKQFISQANRVDDRQMKKSTVMMGHADANEISTSDFSLDEASARQSLWLDRVENAMLGYDYGELPRVIPMDLGDLYLVKVDDGVYSGIFKRVTHTPDGSLEDNAKVRIERMTLPSLVQFCIAKEWINPPVKAEPVAMPEPQVEALTAKLSEPVLTQGQPEMDRKLEILRLLDKLTT